MSTAPQVIEGEVVAKVEEFTTADRVEITAEEKLSVSRLENGFLRAQSEIKRLQGEIESAQKEFPKVIQALIEKYKISVATHVFDNISLEFRKK